MNWNDWNDQQLTKYKIVTCYLRFIYPICKLSRQKVCLHLPYFHLTSRASDVSTLRLESNERLGIFGPRNLLTPGSQSCSSSAATWRLLLIFRKSGKFMLVVQLRGGSSDDLQDVPTVLYVILQHQPNMDLIAGNFLVGVASKMVDGETKGVTCFLFKKTAFKLHTCLHFILPESPVCSPINGHSMKSHSELREQRSVCHPCNHARTNVALNQELPCLL